MANNSTDTGISSNPKQDYTVFNTVVMSLKVIIICVATGGNSLSIAAICRFKYLRYPSNVMIVALAVSDILAVTIYTPIAMIRTNHPVFFNTRASCLTLISIARSVVVGNAVFLSLLSVERFYAVHFPFHYYQNVTIKFNFIWSMVTLVGIIVINIPSICGIDDWSTYGRCFAPILFPRWYNTVLTCTLLTFQIVGLIATFRVVVAELKFRRRERNMRVSDVEKQASVQSTLMILAYGISVCFYLPHILYYLCVTFLQQKPNHVVLETLLILDLGNPAINCFIYGLKNSHFREAYKTLLGFKSVRVEPSTNHESQTT